MELVIKEDTFDVNRITIKNGKNTKKIIYNLDTLSLIGLSLKISQYVIVNQSNKYIMLKQARIPNNALYRMLVMLNMNILHL